MTIDNILPPGQLEKLNRRICAYAGEPRPSARLISSARERGMLILDLEVSRQGRMCGCYALFMNASASPTIRDGFLAEKFKGHTNYGRPTDPDWGYPVAA